MENHSSVGVLVMLSVFSLVGTIGNSLVLYIYANKKTKTTAGVFIMCLAGTDLFTCLVIVPYTEVVIYVQYKLLYDLVCKAYMFLITFNVPFSAFIMVAIAVDRFFCICYPFLHALNLCRARVIILCLLVLACLCGLITALLHGIIPPVDINPSENSSADAAFALSLSNNTEVKNASDTTLIQYTQKENTTSIRSGCAYNVSCNDDVISNQTGSAQSNMTDGEMQGLCIPTNDIIDTSFADVYQKIYSSFYLLSFILVLFLYALIYRSIWKHRAKKRKRKRSSLYPAGVEFSAAETQFTAVTHVNNGNGHHHEDALDQTEMEPMHNRKRKKSKPMSLKDKTLYANIRTAAMLFVVTVVFLIAFLPAWLMAHKILPYNETIFYMYFVYNTANPFIYAFMNKSFRDDLRKILKFS